MSDMNEWQIAQTAPVGEVVIVANAKTGFVGSGFAEWMDGVPIPRWVVMDQNGFGRGKVTHWRPFPAPPDPAEGRS